MPLNFRDWNAIAIRVAAGIMAGLIFVLVFCAAISQIPDRLYWLRDDAVITLSHARNLVDYGTIGVDPSGNRVEGFSAPVNFWAYYLLYAVLGVGPEPFTWISLLVTTFLLGTVFSLFFVIRSPADLALAGLLSFLGAWALTSIYGFLGWHASGMENAATHLLLLASLYVLYQFSKSGKIDYAVALLLALASLSRIEGIWYVAPMLVVFAVYWLIVEKRLAGVWFSLLVLALWGLYQLWRYSYFGSWLPNTGVAQGIDVTARIGAILRLDIRLLQASWPYSRQFFTELGGYLLLLAIPLLCLTRRNRELWLLLALCCSLVLATLAHPFVFGATRLDPVRYATHLPVVIVGLLACLAFHIQRSRERLGIAALILALGVPLILHSSVKPYELCCPAEQIVELTQTIDTAAQGLGLHRPTVALPDLGIISWQKKYNIVDLGYLGSPIMAKLQGNPTAMYDYFLDFAAPDFVKSHGAFSCRFDDLLQDERFLDMYEPVGRLEVSDWTRANCAKNPDSPSGVWVRRALKDPSNRETVLIKELTANLSVDALRRELDYCERLPDANSCQYVTRTAYRFLPEYVQQGLYDKVVDLFGGSKSAPYDQAFLQGRMNGNWHVSAVSYLVQYSARQAFARRIFDIDKLLRGSRLLSKGKLDAYLRYNEIILFSEPCPGRVDQLFFHVVPMRIEDLPTTRRQEGFEALDIVARKKLVQQGSVCLCRVRLPYFPVKSISYGEYQADGSTLGWLVSAELFNSP